MNKPFKAGNQSGQQSVSCRPVVDVPRNIRESVWRVLPDGMVRLWKLCLRFGYALRLEGGSFLGRMSLLLATRQWGVDLGSLGAYLPDGRMIENEWTKARSLGIQELSSRHPWASSIDKGLYLEGFQAGEEFARRTVGLDLGTEARAVVARVPFSTSENANLTPYPAVQQSTKRDPSNPRPLRE